MEETLQRFWEQFAWEPRIELEELLKPATNFIVAGMGGSHLGAWLIKRIGGIPNMTIHRDYGLPNLPQEQLQFSLLILSSYSGSTEEVLDCGRTALAANIPLAVVTTGGKLLEFAKANNIPHIVISDIGLEPRMAIGFTAIAIARLMGNRNLEHAIRSGGKAVDTMDAKAEGERIAGSLKGSVPLIYSSAANFPIAYIWKIKFNETSKIPSFCNVFPELCHNELSGFDVAESTKMFSAHMHAIFLDDVHDHPRIRERMRVAADVLGAKGIKVEHVSLVGDGFGKAFKSAILADWVSMYLAQGYGVPNPETPLIAEFKKRIGQ